MKRVLLTGIAGFIGSNLAKRCVEEGWIVDGVDDMSNGHREFLPEGIEDFFMCDFASGIPLQRIKNGLYDTVFHLAAKPRVSYSVEHPIETNDTNVTKTLRLMEACRGKVGRFVFASSSSVYGGGYEGTDLLPTPEMDLKEPQSPYALQKLIIEQYLGLYSSLYDLDSACMRFFNVIGPNCVGNSPYATALSAWLTAIKSGKPMRSDGDGTQSRDLCYVDNVTDALVRAAKHPEKLDGTAFNVACGDRTSNNELLTYLQKRYTSATIIGAPPRPGDVKHTQADISHAKQVLGYEPVVRVWEGVKRTCDWYDEQWDRISQMRAA